MPGDVSVLSRFLVKFVEIIAAGLATAVSGYLIAHLGGTLISPVPVPARTVIEVAPTNPTTQVPSSISGDLSEQLPATKEAASPASQPARPPNSAKVALPRKHTETATSTGTSTATSAAESKRDQESLVARVRNALANVDAGRTDLPAVPAQGGFRLDPAGSASQPQPAADSSRSAVTGAVPPITNDLRSVPAQPTQVYPLNAVEIQARPVAAAQPSSAAPAETKTGIGSTLEQMLRHDPLAGSEDAPRPPMPVGQ